MSIRDISTDFTLAAYRGVKTAVGEATAVAAASMAAILHTCDLADSLPTRDPWAEIAAPYQIKIDGVKSETVKSGVARGNLVGLYSCFDGFLRSVRKEWYRLSGNEWKKNDDDKPFAEFHRNCPGGHARFDAIVGAELQTGMEHYRQIRNAIVHPDEPTRESSKKFFLENSGQLRELGESLGFREAPHALQSVDFHDIKLLTQLVLRSSRLISCAFDPGDLAIWESISPKLRNGGQGSPQRRFWRLAGILRTKYGLSAERAKRIVSEHLAV